MGGENPILKAPKLSYKEVKAGGVGDVIIEGLNEYGVVYITDIPDFNPQQEYSLIKSFFESSDDTKMQVATAKHNPANQNILRGYGVTKDSAGDLIEEGFNIGRYNERTVTRAQVETSSEYKSREANVWPKNKPEFKNALQKAFDLRLDLARLIVKEMSSSLDYKELENKFSEAEFSMLDIKKYLPRKSANNVIYAESAGYNMVSESGIELAVPDHTDTTITLVSTYTNSGLQALHKDGWYDVPTYMNSMILMTGILLEELTDGKIKALRHRVLDIKSDRFSAPFFFNPSFNADISRSLSGKTVSASKISKIYGPWQVEQLHRDEPMFLNPTSLY